MRIVFGAATPTENSMTKSRYVAALLGSAVGCALIAATASAQTATAGSGAPAGPNPPASATPAPADEQAIIVTGSLFKRNNTETPSPVTVLSSADLQQRGINTIADALQTLTTNNAGALPTAFSANGAFANGASGASLRGLTTDSTLVLFDGLRAAYYPLADDGARNFVDLNTIPEAIVDRLEVLNDGASSTYGADAVAGVINVIIKKQIKGIEGTAEAGISSRGDAAEQRVSLTYGWGDLSTNGFNIYANGEYQRDELLFNSQRGFPFNTANLSSLSTTDATGAKLYGNNGNVNGIQGDGTFSGGNPGATGVAVIRPATADGGLLPTGNLDSNGAPTFFPGQFQLLNTAAGCRGLKANNIGLQGDGTNYGTLCEQDDVSRYGVIQPAVTRIGGAIHATARIGGNAEAYAMFNYYRSEVGYPNAPANIRTQTNSGDISTFNIVLPITLTSGQLNPQNPFAAQDQYARLFYRFTDIPSYTQNVSETYRGAIGINGHFGDNWTYTADATGMANELVQSFSGVPYFANVLKVVADGTYNFVNPELNSQAIRDFVAPPTRNKSTSKLYQAQASIGKDLFRLPGGRVQLALGGSIRYEEVNAPSANSANPPDPTQQYYPLINGFGAKGHRYVESGYFELKAPVFDTLEVDASGRYDNYSAGYSHFSPKIGAKFTPIKAIAFRGTFSKGFRAPSFAETGALPTTGFITVTPGGTNADGFRKLHSNADGSNPSQYLQPYFLGLTTEGTTGLRPETSTNWTAGTIIKPTRWLKLTAEYYNISKKDVITGADYSQAVNAYYNNQPIPAGFAIVQDIPDPQFPNAQRRVFNVIYGFVNANSLVTDGIDVGATANVQLPYDIKWTSSGNATYILRLNQTVNGATQHYAGTLGPYAITSASGTPQWRANWQNTFETGPFTMSATAYYTSGYIGAADDATGAGTGHNCAFAIASYLNSNPAIPLRCHVKSFVQVDLTGSIKVDDKITFYLNMLNALDVKPPFDPNTYGGNNYNPAFGQAGIVGRYFRAGVNIKY
jgi:iron complex outermembrane receptor protein